MVRDAGVTATDATGMGVTVIGAAPVWPSLVAGIVTGPPAALPVTKPFASTVAMVALLVCHVTARPVSGLPFPSFGVAVSCTVALTCTLAEAGLTATDATGVGFTVMADAPDLPSLPAVVVTGPPPASPVTSPPASTG